MMVYTEYLPGDRAPGSGEYEELNVFGTPTGRVAAVAKDEELPAAPRGFTWRPLAEHSIDELRARAAEDRRMAGTATTASVRDSLRKLGERFDALANRRESGEPEQARTGPDPLAVLCAAIRVHADGGVDRELLVGALLEAAVYAAHQLPPGRHGAVGSAMVRLLIDRLDAYGFSDYGGPVAQPPD